MLTTRYFSLAVVEPQLEQRAGVQFAIDTSNLHRGVLEEIGLAHQCDADAKSQVW